MGYTIEFKTNSGTFMEYTTTCDGMDATISGNLECKVPLLALQDTGFELVQGAQVQARVSAVNAIGSSTPSAVNSGGAIVE